MQFHYATLLTLTTLLTSALSTPITHPTSRNPDTAHLSKRDSCQLYSGREWVIIDGIDKFIKAACMSMVSEEGKHLGATDKVEYSGHWDNETVLTKITVLKAPITVTYEWCVSEFEALVDECYTNGYFWEKDYIRGGTVVRKVEDSTLHLQLDVYDD